MSLQNIFNIKDPHRKPQKIKIFSLILIVRSRRALILFEPKKYEYPLNYLQPVVYNSL